MIFRNQPSISKHLTQSLVMVIALLSTVFVGIYYYRESVDVSLQLEKTADKYIHSIAGTLEIPLWDMDRENINTVCRYYIDNNWVVRVKLTGASGEVLFHENKNKLGDLVYRSRQIAYDGEPIGVVEIALSAGQFHSGRLESLKIAVAGLLICVIGLVVFTGFLLKKIIGEPLAALGEVAASYSKGNYHPEINITPYREFDPFVSVLFKMGETIECQMNDLRSAEKALKKHRDSLEEIVAHRTAALKDSNEKLQKEIQHRKQAEDALRMNEKRLEAILRSSPVGIGLVIGEQWTWVNETLLLMTGYEENEVLHRNVCIFFKESEVYQKCFKALTRNDSHIFSGNIEALWIRKDGTLFDCMLRSYPLDMDDPSKGHIFAVSDISDRKASERALREKDRLQGVLELSGAVSHEMTQPLMSAMGYFDLIRLDMPEDAPYFARIDKIKLQLERMSDITKKLMEISRYQTKEYLDGQILDLSKSSDRDPVA